MHNQKRNGVITKDDYRLMADTFIREFRLKDEEADEIQKWLVDGWAALVEYVETSDRCAPQGTPAARDVIPTAVEVAVSMAANKEVTEDMYVRAFGEILQLQPCPFPIYFAQMVEAFFDVFDGDNDGYLTKAEMVKGLACFGFTVAARVSAVFEDLDTCGRGRVDRKTYVNAWLEFMQGTDRAAAMAKHFTADMLAERN